MKLFIPLFVTATAVITASAESLRGQQGQRKLAYFGKWKSASNGRIPPGAFEASVNTSGEAFYVCTCSGTPGYVRSGTSCYYGFRGYEFGCSNYKVLTDENDDLVWRNRNRVDSNDDLVYGGYEEGRTLYICRPKGKAMTGKTYGIDGICYVGWYGDEDAYGNFDVLTG
mmetsp:Transcript_32956/g.72281  ORF Transcript_32956/g.72281 Transcript_32956/m.72281 type:complete len:169 (+) Transcript_32956:265-771(+)|eukprot:CAMPEP_0178515566 /NCGR_PEP_ID=MMETSP0696-20121128/24625_1 /TAXON_ID=265572 /ORGANISM="Extubocellulus spinifer, Strain CCMP396" /LENGTH=168 /DNA_ID=CAMNT_0020145737 /DNA_START=239 /DNA_END=745 /DNA_ORIENTATION=+